MVEALDRAGRYLFVVKQNRLNPTVQLLKAGLLQKRFGRIYMAVCNVLWTRPQDYYDSAAWRGTWEFDGGAFANQASHYVDLLDWLLGPVESVNAQTATLARNIEVEDSGVVSIRWRNGAIGSMNDDADLSQNLEGSLTVLGERGTVRLGGVALNRVEHWAFADAHPDDELVTSASYQTSSVYGLGHGLYYGNVIQTLRGDAAPLTDGREGLRSLELLIAIHLSARDGKRVSLPLSLGMPPRPRASADGVVGEGRGYRVAVPARPPLTATTLISQGLCRSVMAPAGRSGRRRRRSDRWWSGSG